MCFDSQAGRKTDSDSTPSSLRRKHGPGGADRGDENQPQERVGSGATYRLSQLHSRYSPSSQHARLHIFLAPLSSFESKQQSVTKH